MISKKQWYYIEYWDRYSTKIRFASIKAKNAEQAKNKFYNKNPYTLIRKISLV